MSVVLPKITPITIYGIEPTEKTSANTCGSLKTLHWNMDHIMMWALVVYFFVLFGGDFRIKMLNEQADLDEQRFRWILGCEFKGIVHALVQRLS